MNIDWNVFLASGLATTLVGGLGWILKLGVERGLKKRDEHMLTKRELANHIIKIVTEGQQSGYNIKPRSSEHLYYIQNQLLGWDEKISNSFSIFITNWMGCAILQENVSHPINDKFMISLKKIQANANEQTGFLLAAAHKWAK